MADTFENNEQNSSIRAKLNANAGEINTNTTNIADLQNPESTQYTPISAPSHSEGLLFYDDDNKCHTSYNDKTNVSLQIGRELWTRACNNTGVQIDNGKVVYISGVDTGCPEISLAQPNEFIKSRIIGVVTENIADGTQGEITAFGLVRDADTSGLSTGVCYLTSDGSLTSNQPSGADFTVIVGVVLVVDGSNGVIYVNPSISDITVEVTDTNGFSDTSETTLSFSNSSPDRTFTITPVSTTFHYYVNGKNYSKESAESVVIDNTEGLHVIYYDGETLTALANPTAVQIDTTIRTKAIISYIYWDSTNSVHNYFADERHGISMSPLTHSYLHFTRGAQFLEGLGLGDFVISDGADNEDAQFSCASGSIADEDLYITFDAITSTTGMPIYYLTGATGNMRRVTQSGFSCRTFDGTSATRLAYNEWTGSAWQLTEVTSNSFVLYHIFAVNGYTGEDKQISVMGQNEYGTKSQARAGATAEISSIIVAFPFEEIVPIGTVIFQTNTGYANDVNAKIVQDGEGNDYVDWRTTELAQGTNPSDHNNLTNLQLANTTVSWGHIDDQAQTIYGVKTFNSFPITPSSAPSTDYQASNKKYVDDTMLYGTGTKAQMEAASTMSAGDRWFNTDNNRVFTYDGEVWLTDGLVKYTNQSGGTLEEGDVLELNISYDEAVQKITTTDSVYVIGVCYSGAANGSTCTLAVNGKWRVKIELAASRGDSIYSYGTTTAGVAYPSASITSGHFGYTNEANATATVKLVSCLIINCTRT